ncbi:response regulator transcription factor [Paenibacillus sp. PAMC21692]|uniref:response regulator n=1 Tax=Paenibacillus sp. PAMC21692 TaxID=2762320 RepID=UPI00164CF0E3|nr:response regulator transcription factor [Paenibacillus sp. PAMC21692]QNK59172.1 response regulator transcription factor [Paenibacillus sp. PAMC21692]
MIRIVIADDQMLIREGLGTIIGLEDDMEVLGIAMNGSEAYEMTARLSPDIVLMDVQMPGIDGITSLKRIKSDYPETKVLILTTYLEEKYIVDGLAGGAIGYLLKDMDTNRMIEAIRDAYEGRYILPSEVAAKLAIRIADLSKEIAGAAQQLSTVRWPELTEREQMVAALIVKGCSNREIAAQLYIAEGTVRNYISTLYSKLEVSDRVQAIVLLQSLLRA